MNTCLQKRSCYLMMMDCWYNDAHSINFTKQILIISISLNCPSLQLQCSSFEILSTTPINSALESWAYFRAWNLQVAHADNSSSAFIYSSTQFGSFKKRPTGLRTSIFSHKWCEIRNDGYGESYQQGPTTQRIRASTTINGLIPKLSPITFGSSTFPTNTWVDIRGSLWPMVRLGFQIGQWNYDWWNGR